MKHPAFLLVFLFPSLLFAQTNQPEPQNLISNGSFEFSTPVDNLWDGVDADGYLAGFQMGVPAITESGAVAGMAMPVSVQVADMNGDGLLDLITADPAGYYRIYFNSGTKTEPKFTTAEMLPFFPTGYANTDWHEPRLRRLAPKIFLADTTRSGKQDLVIGDYGGDILFVPNTGTLQNPEFRQAKSYADYEVKTTKEGNVWGNLFAPVVYDWDNDFKLDLLVGEGSYSANAIHLLMNQGSNAQPKFTEDKTYFLAYGDGKEQLVPAVVDYNGDGIPDLLVGDSKGTISVYLGKSPKKYDNELAFASFISFGKTTSLGGCIAPAVADLNGDGLFDLIIGKANGRIAVAYNKGTKTEPKFDVPVELKGADLWNRNTLRFPSGWACYTGWERGNMYGQVSAVSAEDDKDANPVDGKYALKLGWLTSPNKFVKYTPVALPNGNTNDVFDNRNPRAWFNHNSAGAGQDVYWIGTGSPGNTYILRKIFSTPPKPGVDYTLSFKVHGHGVKLAQWAIDFNGEARRTPDKIFRGERGSAHVTHDRAKEYITESSTFPVPDNWTTVSKTLNFKFRDQELNDPEHFEGDGAPRYWAILDLHFSLENPGGVCYVDDVKFVERK